MTCIIGTLLTILTGYVMSRFRFQGRDTIRKTTLLLGMFPGRRPCFWACSLASWV